MQSYASIGPLEKLRAKEFSPSCSFQGFDRFGQGQGNFPGSQQGSSNLPLQMLQHQVEQQPQVIPPHVNGSSPIKFMHDGPGFDPFQREPEKIYCNFVSTYLNCLVYF